MFFYTVVKEHQKSMATTTGSKATAETLASRYAGNKREVNKARKPTTEGKPTTAAKASTSRTPGTLEIPFSEGN
jgi:hypothetical protein